MFSDIWQKIKEVINRMIGRNTIEQTLHVSPAISSDMINAIELWDDMYKGKAPWIKEPNGADPVRVVSLGLPAFIASEKARMATLEMKSEITSPNPKSRVADRDIKDAMDNDHINNMESEIKTSKRVEFLNKAYQDKILSKIRPQLEYGIATGGLVIKPYIITLDDEVDGVKAKIDVDFISANNFYPLAFTVNGDITEAAFVQTKVDKDKIYRRVEHHKLNGSSVTILNKAFVASNVNLQDSVSTSTLGREVPLSEVPEWKDFEPETVIENVDRLLFSYFKMPEANTIDPVSPLGMSGYGRAKDLIKDADEQYSRLLWEFEATEAAIDVDITTLKPVEDRNGNVRAIKPTMQERLFRGMNFDETEYEPFLPTIRDASLINGLNTILTRIEDTCALSRGTISTVNVEATTATELKILRQRSYSVNADIQKSLEKALDNAIKIMDIYCDLYQVTEKADYEVSFEWDDSILVDTSEELGKRIQLVQNGVYSKMELRMWYFGETEEQAKQALKIIEDENKKSIMENAKLQQEAGAILGTLQNNTKGQQQLNGKRPDGREGNNYNTEQ